MRRSRLRALVLAHYIASYSVFVALLASAREFDWRVFGFGLVLAPLIVPVLVAFSLFVRDWSPVGRYVPAAVYVIAFAPSYWLAMKRLVRTERRVHGLCIHCGYDLTGNTSGACRSAEPPLPAQLDSDPFAVCGGVQLFSMTRWPFS